MPNTVRLPLHVEDEPLLPLARGLVSPPLASTGLDWESLRAACDRALADIPDGRHTSAVIALNALQDGALGVELRIARRFSDCWSVSGRVGWEQGNQVSGGAELRWSR